MSTGDTVVSTGDTVVPRGWQCSVAKISEQKIRAWSKIAECLMKLDRMNAALAACDLGLFIAGDNEQMREPKAMKKEIIEKRVQANNDGTATSGSTGSNADTYNMPGKMYVRESILKRAIEALTRHRDTA